MTNEYKYQPIEKSRSPSLFGITPEESNNIIKNLVNKIEEYEKAREMNTSYSKEIDKRGRERIMQAEMISKDLVIKGKIKYRPPFNSLGFIGGCGIASVDAIFTFNTKDSKYKEEYLGLVKIIKEI